MGKMIEIDGGILRIHPHDSQRLDFSRDGSSWRERYSGSSYGDFNDLLMLSNGEILAQTSEGIYRSENGGDSWRSIHRD